MGSQADIRGIGGGFGDWGEGIRTGYSGGGFGSWVGRGVRRAKDRRGGPGGRGVLRIEAIGGRGNGMVWGSGAGERAT